MYGKVWWTMVGHCGCLLKDLGIAYDNGTLGQILTVEEKPVCYPVVRRELRSYGYSYPRYIPYSMGGQGVTVL